MKSLSFLLFITFFLLSFIPVSAQKYLVFDNLPKSKRYRFQVGDELSFKLIDQPDMTKSIITELGDNYIVFDHLDNVRLEQISNVKIDLNGPWSGIRDVTGYIVPVVGVGYAAIYTVNNLSNDFEAEPAPYVAAALSVGYGILMQLLKRKTYKINSHHKLYVINMGNSELAPFHNK